MESLAQDEKGLAGTSSSVPISIQSWTQLACQLPSKNAFVESAVSLAYMLTKHLSEIMITEPVELTLEDFITANQVLIFVERQSLPLHGTGYAPMIMDVRFHFEAPDVIKFLSVLPLLHTDSSKKAYSHRKVCAALGKLLLEIFSRGRSSSVENSGYMNTANNYNDSSDCAENNQAIMRTAAKRQVTMPASGSKSSLANNLLLELGMPLSVCRLVCDLLEAESEPCSSSSLTSVDEALWDLTQMKNNPQSFLFDRTSPKRALDDTCLFGNTDDHLFGRDGEINELMIAKNKVSLHVHAKDTCSNSGASQGSNFLCEAVFLAGYAGSGKSVLLRSLISVCNEEQWFVLGCKFDKKSAPHMILSKAFDDFFGKYRHRNEGIHSSLNDGFNDVCRRIYATIDSDGFNQLCDLIPNFAKVFPLVSPKTDHGGISSMDKIGSAKKRLENLFHVLLKTICSAGRPVLITFDDLQWSGSSAMDYLTEFVVNQDTSEVSSGAFQQGILIAGTYRSNEVKEGDDFIQNIDSMKESERVNVTMLAVGELSNVDVTKLVSVKLCLPIRYIRELAELVHQKTRGNPFFVIQFLRCIIQNKMVEFSVKSRRWVWDNDTVDMQMISDGVAELLTTTFSNLPSTLMQTLKIVSCLGSQVEESTIDAMNSRNQVLHANMHEELQSAVKEGIMEKAGPIHQFTHDIIQQTVYDLIPAGKRIVLHKVLGLTILKSAGNNPVLHLLAVDQINIFCKDSNPNPEERCQFARANAKAAKCAIDASSFDQARSYIDRGIELLDIQHWNTNYSLSLDLFEMSASVSCMHGDAATMTTCLDEIFSHARTFDDSLKASSLLVKQLASLSKFEEARSNCLAILSNLGEVFPSGPPLVQNELSAMQTSLRTITYDQIKQLPTMTDRKKLNVMQFLNMLCMYSVISKPMLLPLLSRRMVSLMMEYGMCDDAIVGLVTAGYCMKLFTEDIQLASNIGAISERLVEDSPKRHILRSRVCNELYSTLKMIKEPCHYKELYNSAMLAGDVENAMICRWSYNSVAFWAAATLDLHSVWDQLVICMKEAAKFQQNTMLYNSMALFHSCSHLTGKIDHDVEIKSLDELNDIGEKTNNASLVWQTFMCRMTSHFWMREYMAVAELSEKHSRKHPSSSEQKRILHLLRCFQEGIAYCSLARDTKEVKWRKLSESALSKITQWPKQNVENKLALLHAEIYFLNGEIESAEVAYKASIKSACKNRFIHEEALAYELYGLFCVKNSMVGKGSEQLHHALDRYKQWGATKKVHDLQIYIDLIGLCDQTQKVE